ncbi:hypothetical protein PGT21_035503 [Puccinia graminis f. sp. tritici]|uniref:Uncharacterized protein n=1 Tax=Puccinia graminis f. sp. tritici TaxID=56615 RepID=A0A5B0PN95_PUCGR|nr:hypothetical protein PGT21_035503 [Puccinia graminis f. sp. tritici]
MSSVRFFKRIPATTDRFFQQISEQDGDYFEEIDFSQLQRPVNRLFTSGRFGERGEKINLREQSDSSETTANAELKQSPWCKADEPSCPSFGDPAKCEPPHF